MQIAPSLPVVAPAAPVPAVAGNGAAPDQFAALLDRQQSPPAAPAPAAAAEDTESPEPAPQNNKGARPADSRSVRGRVPTSRSADKPAAAPHARGSASAEAAEAAEPGESKATKADPPAHDDSTPTVDPALAHWLAGLHLPAAPQTAQTASGASGAPGLQGAVGAQGSDAPASADGSEAAGSSAPRRGLGHGIGLHGGADGRAEARKEASAPGREFRLEVMAETREASASAAAAAAPAAAERPAAIDLPAAALLAAPAPSTAGPTGSAPVDVNLPMAPDAPEFAQAFAVQVSVLARDGVQQAELHLNPAETGPVSVQIVMEGNQARIEFGADALPTRQAIEHSLPDLAAALRDAGLTLSGGGVSEHSRGRQADADAQAERSGTIGGAARRAAAGAVQSVTVRPARGAASPGGIDLFA